MIFTGLRAPLLMGSGVDRYCNKSDYRIKQLLIIEVLDMTLIPTIEYQY